MTERAQSDIDTVVLPAGWVVRRSVRRPDLVYYVHQATGQRQWQRPECIGISDDSTEAENEACRSHYNRQAHERRHERQQSPIIELRRANNRVKQHIIDQALSFAKQVVEQTQGERPSPRPIVVLELGCGKGGDLHKYGAWSLQYRTPVELYALDISEDSIDEMRRRWRTLDKRFPFLRVRCAVGDFCAAENADLPADWPVADIVSVQFALHYAFESAAKVRRFGDNVARALAWRNSLLIGTVVDHSTLMQRLLQAERSATKLTFGNDLYSVCMPVADLQRLCKAVDSRSESLYGIGYDMSLHGCLEACREFLVVKDELDRLLAVLGFDCGEYTSFASFEQHGRLSPAEIDAHNLYAAFCYRRPIDLSAEADCSDESERSLD